MFNSNIDNFDLSVNAAFMESLSNTLGLSVSAERGLNKKTGLYLNTTYSPWKNINISAKLEGTTYKNLVDSTTNFNELILNVVMNFTW